MKTIKLEKNSNNKIIVREDTQYILTENSAGIDNIISLNLIFEKEGVSAEVLGIFNLKNNMKIKLETISEHLVPDTSCETKIKTILPEGSAFDFLGRITIRKKAQQTTAFLSDNVLVTGTHTNRKSHPVLEIEANDVKVSHASTTGRISDEQLYYLKSRGLNRLQSEEIIKRGFLLDLIEKIKDRTIREMVINEIKSKGDIL